MFATVAPASVAVSTAASTSEPSEPSEPPSEPTDPSDGAEEESEPVTVHTSTRSDPPPKMVKKWKRAGTPLTHADVHAWVFDEPSASTAQRGADADPGYPTPGLADRLGSRAAATAARNDDVWKDPACQTSWYSGNDVYLRTCTSWYKVSAKNRVVTFKVVNLGTGHGENENSPGSDDCFWNCDEIQKVGSAGRHQKGKGIVLHSWDPSSTESIQNKCKPHTTATTFGSASVSSTTKVCPDKLDTWHIETLQESGSRWKGDGTIDSRSAHSVAVGRWDKTVGQWNGWNAGTITYD